MGSVATFVSNEVEANTLKVKEGDENEEYLINRLDHVSPPVNMINVYGGQGGNTVQLGSTKEGD